MAPSDGVVPQGRVLSQLIHGNRFQDSGLIGRPSRLTSVLEHAVLGTERKMSPLETQSKPVDRDNGGAGWTFGLRAMAWPSIPRLTEVSPFEP